MRPTSSPTTPASASSTAAPTPIGTRGKDRLARYHGLTTFDSNGGTLVAEDDMISSYGVWRIDSHDASGTPTRDTAQVLDVFRKEAGAWKIVQETITWRTGAPRTGQLHAALKAGPRQAMVG